VGEALGPSKPIGELEQFSTWRGKTRIKAQDFNFWGVTFTASSNTFYATLSTAGKTYLVKGDLGLRRFALPLIDRLTEAELATPMRHADYGDISVAWLLAWCAGHERRHLGQLEALV